MPEYIGVKCFNEPKCGIFQVIQKRKDNKWQCKICGNKQSIIKIYAISYKASDIRPLIQQYNLNRGKDLENNKLIKNEENIKEINNNCSNYKKESKWNKYIDKEILEELNKNIEEEGEENEKIFILNNKIKRKWNQKENIIKEKNTKLKLLEKNFNNLPFTHNNNKKITECENKIMKNEYIPKMMGKKATKWDKYLDDYKEESTIENNSDDDRFVTSLNIKDQVIEEKEENEEEEKK